MPRSSEREDISKNTIAKNVRDVSSSSRRDLADRKKSRKGKEEHEQEIKMCLVRLYFIRRAQNFYFRCSLTLAARSFIN